MRLPDALRRREPWIVLVPLVLVQWGALIGFALTVRHNGWVYYQGGDQLLYYDAAWSISEWQLPRPSVGYGWPLSLLPFALVWGPHLLDAFPAILLFQVVVLGPIATWSVYRIATWFGGRAIGYASAVIWVAIPFAAIPLFSERYHEKYVEQFLPQALGLTAQADYPSMVILLVGSVLLLRAIDRGDAWSGALAGLAVGYAVGVKSSNLLFLPGAVLALALARRGRALAGFAVVLAPPLATFVVWRYRGLGELPLAAPEAVRVAAGTVAVGLGGLRGIAEFDWNALVETQTGLRENFWSVRLLEWLPIAGAVAVARRSLPAGALLAGWLLAFLVVKGMSPRSSIDSANFFRHLMPAFPAFLIMAASVPLLVPSAGDWLVRRARAPGWSRTGDDRRFVLPAAAILLILPLALVLVLPQTPSRAVLYFLDQNTVLAVVNSPRPEARLTTAGVELRWRPAPTTSGDVFYRLYRSTGDGSRCDSRDCYLAMEFLGAVREPRYDDRPPPGTWTYRVAVAANWLDDTDEGDAYTLGPPVTVEVQNR